MTTIPTRSEVLLKVLRKLISPRELKNILRFKIVFGDEYPYFDLADFLPWVTSPLSVVEPSKFDSDSPIFIAGLRRSGTTVFYRIMNANKHLYLFNERFPGDRMNGRGVASLLNLYSTVDDAARFRRIALRYLSPMLKFRYNNWGAKLALELAHPDPGSISLPAMKRILNGFPRAKIIGIIRDPRDFVLSAISRGGHDVDWWIGEYLAMMQLFQDLENNPEVSFCWVKYEDLVDDTEKTVMRCCEFAGIPFQQEMLVPSRWSTKGPQEYESNKIVKKYDKWRTVKGADLETVRSMTAACFPRACHFGYMVD